MADSERRRKALGTPSPHYAHASATLLAETEADPPPMGRNGAPDGPSKAEWEALFQHVESRFQALYTWRVPFWTTWGQIARYLKPYRFYAFVVDNLYNKGLREDFAIVDRTGTMAGEDAAAGLMGLLTDPDRNWLKLGPAIPGFQIDQAGKTYYKDVTERLNFIYDNSNFYESQAQLYDDLVFFGTGTVLDYEDASRILNCVNACAGEYLLANNFENDTGVFYREYRMTVSAIVEMFGIDNCPPDIQKMWKQKGGALEYERVIGHAIEPNFPIMGPGDGSAGVVPGGFTWREVFWVRGKKEFRPLSITGFHEQPFSASRWSQQGNEAYGRGIGENMLGDVIQLQLETRQKAESIEKVNRPPMGADVSLMNLPASTNPGKITYMNTANGGEKKFFPLYEVKPDIPAISADIGLIQERIRKTAYNDVFQRLATLREQMKLKADITATEVEQLTEEAMRRLGPLIFRVYRALHERVQRHLAIMERKGLMPKKPPSLQNVPLKIEFISLLTEARKAVETQAIARTGQFAGSLVGVWPEVRYKFKAMDAVERFADGVGCDPSLIRTDDEAQALIGQEAQKQRMAEAMQQTAVGAQAASALSKTSLAPGNALSALVGGPQ